MEGSLKGDLFNKLNQNPEESKLKGKLLDGSKEKGYSEYSEDWLKSKTLVQRDGGDRFIIKDIINQTSGSSHKRIVQLVSLEDNHTFNKEFLKIIEDLKNVGSAWSIEK